jgi:hypothetical protein
VSFPTKGVMVLQDRLVYEPGAGESFSSHQYVSDLAGIITLHPHPTCATALACLIAGNDDTPLELAARLFPVRTGVPVSWDLVAKMHLADH